MNDELAKQLTHSVHDFYETEGAWFATTRDKVMPEHEFVDTYIRPGITVVDVGAGNGRFAKLLPENVTYIGVEPAAALRRAATSPNPSLARRGTSNNSPPYEGGAGGGSSSIPGSLPHLPISDHSADVTVCLAVLHHIPTAEQRHASVAELIRVTKPGGIVLATSWFQNPHARETRPVDNGEPGDVWMPWTAPDGRAAQRFVHFMQPGEWQNLWTNSDLEIIRIGMFAKQEWSEDPSAALNWRLIARRR